MMGGWLDWVILWVFSNLGDSMIESPSMEILEMYGCGTKQHSSMVDLLVLDVGWMLVLDVGLVR